MNGSTTLSFSRYQEYSYDDTSGERTATGQYALKADATSFFRNYFSSDTQYMHAEIVSYTRTYSTDENGDVIYTDTQNEILTPFRVGRRTRTDHPDWDELYRKTYCQGTYQAGSLSEYLPTDTSSNYNIRLYIETYDLTSESVDGIYFGSPSTPSSSDLPKKYVFVSSFKLSFFDCLPLNDTVSGVVADFGSTPIRPPELPEKAMTKPYPLALWRTSETAQGDKIYTNDGMPYHMLFPDLVGYNLYIQESSPLIHIYGTGYAHLTNFNLNGFAIVEPVKCTVYSGLNREYSAQIKVECDDYGKYEYLKKQALLKIPIQYHGEISEQVFRVASTRKTMDSNGICYVSAQAFHIFYDNNHNLINSSHPTLKTGDEALTYIMTHSVYGESHYFTYSSDISTPTTAYYDNISVTDALIGADQCFVNRWGGKLYRDNLYFSINTKMENYRNSGVIAYGYNMTEIEFEEDDSELITDLIAEDNFGHYVHLSVSESEKPYAFRIYGYTYFTYEDSSETLFNSDAQAYFDNHSRSRITITVKFLNLSDTEKYAQFLELDSYEVGDKITIYHKDLGIYYQGLEIISKEYDVCLQKTTEIQIGNDFKSALFN